ncbi:hypothetical protein N0V94_008434 [Neodidymelliopsis sp. IMI 364377]|nr:hypothetical protein N0V94_008434 [Neodidymelliopsis sp. IMI 364377]
MLRILLVSAVAAVAGAKCYEPTVAHPLPEYDANEALLKHAFAEIDSALISAVAAPKFAATSFSIEITSSKGSLWSKHHTARERNASRPDIPEVNGDALYRIASITKTFTVLGLLYQEKAGNLSLDDPVDKYITEFTKDDGTLPWKDITLRSLAKLLNDVKSKIPIFAPNQQSTYSNLAFELLGLVLERVTSRSYQSYIEEAIFNPLNMSKSTLSVPSDKAGVIPSGRQWWDVEEGIQNPTGGIYSSTKDMSKYLRHVLTHYNGLTHALNWLNPVSPARGLNSFYGLPWEIYQTDRILQDSRRPVRFITKSGGLPGYSSVIIVAPEYDLGITILLAGNQELISDLKSSVTEIIRPAEQLAVRQLNNRYAGTYASSDPELNSSVTLIADHRGLVVTEFISNSSDILQYGRASRWLPKHSVAQLVPTLLYRNAKVQKGEEWRVQPVEERGHDTGDVWDDFCITDIEGPLYAGVPLNNFVFWDEKKEAFDTLELSAFRVNLTRVPEKKKLAEENMEL